MTNQFCFRIRKGADVALALQQNQFYNKDSKSVSTLIQKSDNIN